VPLMAVDWAAADAATAKLRMNAVRVRSMWGNLSKSGSAEL